MAISDEEYALGITAAVMFGIETLPEKKEDKSSEEPVTGVKIVEQGVVAFGHITNCHCVPAGVIVVLSGRVTVKVPEEFRDPVYFCGTKGAPFHW